MFEKLETLIDKIQNEYIEVTSAWEEFDTFGPINMHKKKVKHAYNNSEILAYAFEYINFINNNYDFSVHIQINDAPVYTRVKARNSVQSKVEKYMIKDEKGEFPINKCLNDLLGIRIIFDEDITFETINSFIQEKFPSLKCIDSTKKVGYTATHIYFGTGNNHNFQWELQVWDKRHEQINFESHRKYKQSYVQWELENKGGRNND